MIKKIQNMIVVMVVLSGFCTIANDAPVLTATSGWKKKACIGAGVTIAVLLAALAAKKLTAKSSNGRSLGAPVSDSSAKSAASDASEMAVLSARIRNLEDQNVLALRQENADLKAALAKNALDFDEKLTNVARVLRTDLVGKVSSDELIELSGVVDKKATKDNVIDLQVKLSAIEENYQHQQTALQAQQDSMQELDGVVRKLSEVVQKHGSELAGLPDRIDRTVAMKLANRSLERDKQAGRLDDQDHDSHVKFVPNLLSPRSLQAQDETPAEDGSKLAITVTPTA